MPDEMHLEGIQSWSPGAKGSNATAADFKNVANRLGIKSNGTIGVVQGVINTVKPSPIPTIYAVRVISAAKTDPKLPAGKTTFPGNVKIVEKALADEKLLDPKYVDGAFGTKTVEAYAAWQKKCKVNATNGIPDIVSLKKLGSLHSFKVV
jgi:peptidoglycan hydrolase-like protein with peptidoglycan-binding domain